METVFEVLWLPGEAGLDAGELTATASAAVLVRLRISWFDTDSARFVLAGPARRIEHVDVDPARAGHLVLAVGMQTAAIVRRRATARTRCGGGAAG
ncbi:hypothetical protein H480_42215 [Amycolatopsis vancoresmycina DSM 44592]|uniref:Uncharacterized protein n=1 Tax=Amycolatopsis vancoresmycina DSM 44592 TaxID=1292037 RepID=R1FHA7_9PSEU|nr:hypothetical protein H480_42215 [Amycolatopsis vancoresmycina DSM 44592]